jgi:probable phosphoglycerate mutase
MGIINLLLKQQEVIALTKIYLVRHCEAEGNRLKIFQGSTDCDVSEQGAKQLEYLNRRFASVHIDKVFSSPLKRARKTAEVAVRGKDLSVNILEGFTEMHAGIIEGKPFAESFVKYPDLKNSWNNDIQNFAPENGESMREVYARAKKAFWSLVNDPENKDKTLLVASHGAVLKTLLCHLIFDDVERLSEVPWLDNTAVTLVTAEGEDVKVEYLGDVSHLPEDEKPVSVLKLWEKKD